MTKICVVLSDPSELFRRGLAFSIASEDMEVVESVSSMEAVAETIKAMSTPPDVVLFDMGADSRAELAVVRELMSAYPTVKFAILTALVSPTRMRTAIQVGVKALLSKETSVRALQLALLLVSMGEQVFPAFDPAKLSETTAVVPTGRPLSRGEFQGSLTEREREVLEFLSTGMNDAEISAQLAIAKSTIKVHLRRIFKKTGAKNRVQAAIIGLKQNVA